MNGLRFRVTAWSVAANGLALGLGFALLIWVVDQQLSGAFDESLTAQAQSTAEAVGTWLADQPGGAAAALESPALKRDLQDLFTPPQDVPSALPTMVSLLDHRGAPLLSTHSNTVDQPSAEVLRSIRDGATHRSTATLTGAADEEHAYRVITVPVPGKHTKAYVQVVAPLEALHATLSRLQVLLAAGAGALLLLNAALVFGAMRRAFRPVDRLVEDIHQVTDRNLTRVPVPAAYELKRLAQAFNTVLDRLERGFQFQTRLFQDLSHQLKTPLAVLSGTLETTLSRVRSAGEYEHILESSLDEVGKMTHLIESLLLLAQLDSQQLVLRLEAHDLAVFCRGWAEDFSLLWEAKGLRVLWRLSGPLPVLLDPARLGQALLNLLDNAVKYSPEGGELEFRFGQEGAFAFVELLNQGPPLAAGSEEAIFARFAHEAGTPGFGLGLPIARAAAEGHGGSLTAFHPPRGAGFRLALPLVHSEKSLISS